MPEIIPNLHPLAVHFPIVLVTLSAVFHVVAVAMCGKDFSKTLAALAHTLLWLSALSVLPTVFLGWQAYNSVTHDDASHAAMLVHRNWALATSFVLIFLAIWDARRNKIDSPPVWWFAVAVIAAWSMVAITAWHGGELVYRHGLGVMSLPVTHDGTGHDHHHEIGASTSADEHSHADTVLDDQVHEHSQHDHTH
jgi:uncharacterized membrane protein